jgi:hypothetical protein
MKALSTVADRLRALGGSDAARARACRRKEAHLAEELEVVSS